MTEKNITPVNHFPAADGIRGLAVMIVMFAHALVMFLPATRPFLGGTGKIGVWLFFVLSSFLLTNKFIKNGLTRKSLLEYSIGRFFRIIPIFILACLFYYSAGYFDIYDLAKITTFQQGYGHLWTIPVEFKFYFILPFFILILTPVHKRHGLLPVIVLAIIAIIVLREFFPPSRTPDNSIYTHWYIPSFLVGIIASYMAQNISGGKRRNGLKISICFFGVAVIIPAVSYFLFGRVIIGGLPSSFLSLSIVWGCLILLAVRDCGIYNNFFSSSAMRNIGNKSFSIYLFHWFFLTEMSKLYPNNALAMAASILMSTIAGWLIFALIEKPIENYRHRLQKSLIR